MLRKWGVEASVRLVPHVSETLNMAAQMVVDAGERLSVRVEENGKDLAAVSFKKKSEKQIMHGLRSMEGERPNKTRRQSNSEVRLIDSLQPMGITGEFKLVLFKVDGWAVDVAYKLSNGKETTRKYGQIGETEREMGGLPKDVLKKCVIALVRD